MRPVSGSRRRIESAVIDLPRARLADQREAFAPAQLEIHAVHRVHRAARRVQLRAQAATPRAPVAGRLLAHTRTLGSKPSRTASANRFAASTSASMKLNAVASAHQTTGSRDISRRAALIMVPKLLVDGSTPTPT